MVDCMSMQYHVSKTCALCGKEHTYPVLASTSVFGPCDLDLRPSELKRSTMPLWVMECHFCGYVAKDISKLPKAAEKKDLLDFVASFAYLAAGERDFASDLAARFYKHHMIAEAFGNAHTAFYALMYAAWACDDAGDKDNAVFCRERALFHLDPLLKEEEGNENLRLIQADLLRRSKNFDAVIREFENKSFKTETVNKAIRFQVEKAKEKEDACYTALDVK